MPLIVLVEFTIAPAHAEVFLARVQQQAADSLALEEACTHFDVAHDPADRGRVLLYEIYDDDAAFAAHLASEHFKAFDAEVADWVIGKQVSKWEGPLG